MNAPVACCCATVDRTQAFSTLIWAKVTVLVPHRAAATSTVRLMPTNGKPTCLEWMFRLARWSITQVLFRTDRRTWRPLAWSCRNVRSGLAPWRFHIVGKTGHWLYSGFYSSDNSIRRYGFLAACRCCHCHHAPSHALLHKHLRDRFRVHPRDGFHGGHQRSYLKIP